MTGRIRARDCNADPFTVECTAWRTHLHNQNGPPRISAMLDWSQCPAVERIPGKGGSEWLFKRSRVPVRALFENLEGGATIDDFLEWFPGVTREQVELVLRHAEQSLILQDQI
jgi:uncharacterized protein (DUF433 family)